MGLAFIAKLPEPWKVDSANVLFLSCAPDMRKENSLFEVPRLRWLVFVITIVLR
jgi:hypothetical protein